jgi:hypothetical protein
MTEPKQRKDDRLTNYTGWVALYTAVLAVATIASAGITTWVAYSTRDLRDLAQKQLEEVRKSSEQVKESITVANRQAAAAERANELAAQALSATAETMSRQLRAYVVFDNTHELSVRSNNNGAPFVNVAVNLKNTGITPAFKLHVESVVTFIDVPFAERPAAGHK